MENSMKKEAFRALQTNGQVINITFYLMKMVASSAP